jgi:hypothetical protein
MLKLKNILFEGMELAKYAPNIEASSTYEGFLRSLVGKTLKDILDVSSFLRLYVGNKYGVGGNPDDEDPQVLMSQLLNYTTAFINFRKIDVLRSQLDAADEEDKKRPEVAAYEKARRDLVRAKIYARRDGEEDKLKDLDAQLSKLENPGTYSKNMADMESIIKEFHNRPLTLVDVTPSVDDGPKYKEYFQKAEEIFGRLKKSL